jgi:hypothetical protein
MPVLLNSRIHGKSPETLQILLLKVALHNVNITEREADKRFSASSFFQESVSPRSLSFPLGLF